MREDFPVKQLTFTTLVWSLLFVALSVAPMFADGPCTFPEYSQCGTALPPVLLTVTDLGLGPVIVQGDWFGYYADFTDYTYIHDLTTGYVGPNTYTNHSGQSFGDSVQYVDQDANVAFGDVVEFVIHVANDPNHPDGVDYCFGLPFCVDQAVGHVFAENLSATECDLGIPCVFLGFEDLTLSEQTDYDYNDFEIYLYGVTLNGIYSKPMVVTPEPSSIVLAGTTTLALLIGGFRRHVG